MLVDCAEQFLLTNKLCPAPCLSNAATGQLLSSAIRDMQNGTDKVTLLLGNSISWSVDGSIPEIRNDVAFVGKQVWDYLQSLLNCAVSCTIN